MKARLSVVTASSLVIALVLAVVMPAFSFVPMLTRPKAGGTPQFARWNESIAIRWNLNPNVDTNKVKGTRTVADVIAASFATWVSAPNTAVSVARGADQAGVKTVPPRDSGINLVCLECSNPDHFGDPKTLAVTFVTISNDLGQPDGHGGTTTFVGQIISAPILFNPAVTWDTDGGPNGQDLQTVATHEIGHFFGLDHSGVVRAIMFPAAPDAQRVLSYDDVAGISTLYPKAGTPGACNAGVDAPTGCISGTVRNGSGTAVFGAHVYADSTSGTQPFGGSVRKSAIGAMTAPDGSYTILNIPADSYMVVAEPLDEPMTNGDVPDYGPAFGQTAVQTNFTTRWH